MSEKQIHPLIAIDIEGDECGEKCHDRFIQGRGFCNLYGTMANNNTRTKLEGVVCYRCRACIIAVMRYERRKI